MNKTYSCRELAKLAGVSVRTLHHYDRIGLLKPSGRTQAHYRSYGPAELLQLQQILFYRELDFSLREIQALLSDPEFDLLAALHGQHRALRARQERLGALLLTLNNTIAHLTGKRTMLTNEELYAGFPKETAATYRREAAAKYGAELVAASEQHLRARGAEGFAALQAELGAVTATLRGLQQQGQEPASPAVQAQTERHFAVIKAFWGPAVEVSNQLEAYQGLAQLYLDDPRYTGRADGQPEPEFAAFLAKAM
ncbi:MAG TPA: MerR family transcriptional regulator, partial [Hymenobacter sp.]